MTPPTEKTDEKKTEPAQLLSIAEACALLGIGTQTGYDLIKAEEFPVSVRVLGHTKKVSRPELEAWLATPQPTPDEG